MSPQLNNKERLARDLVAYLQDPEFSDVKIICSDGGEILANKSILGMRSEYFRCMFSANNNFVESQAGTVKLPYSKAVVDKIILYLYSGEMDCEDLALRPMLDLLEQLNLMNLPEEFSALVEFTKKKISEGKFAYPDCVGNLEDSLKLGLEVVGEGLLSYLGANFQSIPNLAEVGALSVAMIRRLLREEMDSCQTISSQTIPRLHLLSTWLSVNSVEAEVKEELLGMLAFDHFTTKQLANEVRKSGLYQTDKIFDRIEQLLEAKDDEDLFLITPEDKKYFETEFDDLQPQAGWLSNETVLTFFVGLGFRNSSVNKIMELFGGSFDKYEFIAAYHLAEMSSGDPIPNQVVASYPSPITE